MKSKLLLLTLTALLLLTGCQQTSQEGPLTIGFIGPLTGSDAPIGTSVQKGVQMAEEELDPAEYEFIYEDDAGDVKKAVSAYNKLRDADNIDALVGVFSPQGNALGPLAEQDEIIYCDVGVSNSGVFQDRDYVVGHWLSPKTEAEKYVEKAREEGIEKVVVLEAIQEGVVRVVEAMEQEFEEAGIEYSRHRFEPDEKDFRTTLAQLKEEDFDAFAFLLFPGQAQPGLKQIKEMGFEQPITSVEIYEYYSDETLQILNRSEDWYVFSANPTPEFTSKFRQKHPEGPLGMAGHGYDCTNIIADAFEQANGDREKAVDYIKSISGRQGAAGTLNYDEGRIDSPAAVKRYVNGSLQVVG